MNKIKTLINKNLSGKKVLVLFIITNLIYLIMLTITIPKTMGFSNEMKLLDMMPMGYDSGYIQALFDALGEEGRRIYLINQIPLDMIYPLLFGISYCLLMAYFLEKIGKLHSPTFYLCLIPLLAGMADYLENLGIITMLNSYPDLSQIVMTTTSLFSITKSMTTTIFFISLIIVLIILGVQFINRKRNASMV